VQQTRPPFTPASRNSRMQISAGEFNAMLAAAATEANRRDGANARSIRSFGDLDVYRVLNSTGSDRDQFDCVGLAGVVFNEAANDLEFKYRPTFDSRKATADDTCSFAILQRPTKDGYPTPGAVAGVTVAKVDVTDLGHRYAVPDLGPNVFRLESAATGTARILYSPGTLGEVLCLVRIVDCPSNVDTQISWQGYLGADQTVLNTGGPDTLLISAACTNLDDTNFSLSSGVLTIAQTGRYDVKLNIHAEKGTSQPWSSPRKAEAWIERYAGSSWNAVPASLAILDTNYVEEDKASPALLVNHTNASHTYRIRATRFEGSADNEDATYLAGQAGDGSADGCYWSWHRISD